MRPDRPRWQRVMLKVSGEIFLGRRTAGIDPSGTKRIADELAQTHKRGLTLAVTVGGGNLFRGTSAAEHGMERTTGDYIGMLATLMNALALQSALGKNGVRADVHSAIRMEQIAEPYVRGRALNQLRKRHVVIFAGGTGNPFFSTDMAAVLRALEMHCDIVLKGTNVDGVYTKDPRRSRGARKIRSLSLLEAVNDPNITVIDNSALALCADHKLPIVVFNLAKPGMLARVLRGEPVGTTLH